MRVERWRYTIPLRLRSLFRRDRVESELDEELRFHVERLTKNTSLAASRRKTPGWPRCDGRPRTAQRGVPRREACPRARRSDGGHALWCTHALPQPGLCDGSRRHARPWHRGDGSRLHGRGRSAPAADAVQPARSPLPHHPHAARAVHVRAGPLRPHLPRLQERRPDVRASRGVLQPHRQHAWTR